MTAPVHTPGGMTGHCQHDRGHHLCRSGTPWPLPLGHLTLGQGPDAPCIHDRDAPRGSGEVPVWDAHGRSWWCRCTCHTTTAAPEPTQGVLDLGGVA